MPKSANDKKHRKHRKKGKGTGRARAERHRLMQEAKMLTSQVRVDGAGNAVLQGLQRSMNLNDFTRAALARCTTSEDIDAVKASLHGVITAAVSEGDAATRDWSQVALPAVPSLSAGFSKTGDSSDETGTMPSMRTPRGDGNGWERGRRDMKPVAATLGLGLGAGVRAAAEAEAEAEAEAGTERAVHAIAPGQNMGAVSPAYEVDEGTGWGDNWGDDAQEARNKRRLGSPGEVGKA